MIASTLSSSGRPELSERDFNRIRGLAYEYCGLDIEVGKEELVASRLGKIMRTLGIASYGQYFDFVVADKSSGALVTMIDSLTTNHTSFFREQQHFNFLASTVLPALSQRPHVEIWSAASSSGEEPYSVAIAFKEFFNGTGPTLNILATDISTRILALAKLATYESQRIAGIPLALQRKYFLRKKVGETELFRFKPEIRSCVRFQRLNLIEPFSAVSTIFPLILCRNVMIYFDAETQESLVGRFFRQMEPGGYLFIGHSESLNRIRHDFEYVAPAIYRKPGTLGKTSTAVGRSA
jgi:chemotaxis protein methyltransferase CheR